MDFSIDKLQIIFELLPQQSALLVIDGVLLDGRGCVVECSPVQTLWLGSCQPFLHAAAPPVTALQ